MSLFEYRVRNAVGEMQTGTLEAANDEAVAGELMSAGLTPISITAVKGAAKAPAIDWQALFVRQVDIEALIVFSRQMYSLSKAGIPMMRALSGLADSANHPLLQKTIREVAHQLESGKALAVAMQEHPKVFSDLYVAIIHVGENSGRLDESFQQMAAYLELERETRKRIKSATRYPTFVIVAMGAGLVIINMFVIPAFSGVFAQLGADLPWQTRALVGLSDFLLTFWPLLVLVGVGSSFGIRSWVATPAGRLVWDKWKLRLPVIGGMFERIHLGRFCRSFAMMLKSGVPIVQGLNVVSHAIGNEYMAGYVRDMRLNIEKGESFLQAAVATKLFTPLVLQMISVGEETGGVDEMLGQAAAFYEQEVDYELKGLADAIEPVLIIGIGAMVLVLALGVFLPLWDLSAAASGQ
jgi:MSHA biogenesis protein MshG